MEEKKIKIKVFGNGKKKEVVTKAFCKDGLAIHESCADNFSPHKWSITHIESGLLVSDRRLKSMKTAREMVGKLNKIMDWTKSAEEIKREIPLGQKLKVQILDF